MKHKELLQLVISALTQFDSQIQGVQEYIPTFLENNDNLSEDESIFVQEVISGCIRHDKAVSVVVDGYSRSETNRKTCLSSDKCLYKILTYLTLYRLDELEMSHYRKFILSQNFNKMHKFLLYFLDENKLKTWMFSEWCKVYDHSYVQINLLSPLLRWLPELLDLVSSLTEKVNNRQRPREIRSPTSVKPFNLTKMKPRSVPIPEKIPILKKIQPAPETTYKMPKEFVGLSEQKQKNRIKAEKQLMKASINQFDCASTEKSIKTKERIKNYIDGEEAKLKFNMSKYRPLPSTHDEESSPIRLNAAAIMREGVLIQKKEEEELKKLENLSTGGRDASEFLSWQKSMRDKDLNEKLADIEAKRLAGRLSYEDAILARQALIDENKIKVQTMKQETKEMMDIFLKEKFQREQEMRNLVEEIIDGHENAKEAKMKLKKYKQSIVAQVNAESRELMKKALEEAEEEMKERIALIAKIRAIESVPIIRFKLVDLTETSGAGLLGEMSVAELRERLHLLKIEEKKEEGRKRNEIIKSKVEKDQYLMDTLQSIAQHRAEKGKEAAIKIQQKRSQSQKEIQDPKVIALQERLSARRAEREKLRIQKSPPKAATKQRIKLKQQKQELEEMRWEELEKTREKAAQLHMETVRRNSSRSNLSIH